MQPNVRMCYEKEGMQHYKSSLFTAFFVFFIDQFGFAVVYPLFGPLLLDPQYGLVAAGTTPHIRNLLLSILFIGYPFAQFFGAPFFGDLADKWGRKKAFVFTIGGVMVGYFLTGIALLFNTYTGLLISRLITGAFAGNMSISLATLADISETPKIRARNFGINAMLSGFAWILAMFAGGYLSNPKILKFFNPSFPFFLTGIITAIGLIVVLCVFKDMHKQDTSIKLDLIKGFREIKLAFSIPKVSFLYLVYLFWTVPWLLVIAWFSTVSIEKFQLSQTSIAWVLIGNGVAWGVGNLLTSYYFITHYKIVHIAMVGYLLCGTCLILSMVWNVWFFAIFFIIASGLAGISWTSILSVISINAPDDIQGLTMGLGQSVMSLGFIFGPLIAGWLTNLNISLPYLFAGVVLCVGFVLLLYWDITHRKKHPGLDATDRMR